MRKLNIPLFLIVTSLSLSYLSYVWAQVGLIMPFQSDILAPYMNKCDKENKNMAIADDGK